MKDSRDDPSYKRAENAQRHLHGYLVAEKLSPGEMMAALMLTLSEVITTYHRPSDYLVSAADAYSLLVALLQDGLRMPGPMYGDKNN